MVKVRRLRKVLAEFLETDLSGYSFSTISGPMSPDRPGGNFVWEAFKLLLLVKNSQGYSQLPVPNLGIGPPALCQDQLFVRHAKTDKNISTTSTVTFKSQLTVRELILKIRLGATHRWYLMYGGKLLEPDVLILRTFVTGLLSWLVPEKASVRFLPPLEMDQLETPRA